MLATGSNPALLYLPLLNSSDPAVRHQAGTLLLGSYGEQGLTLLRRLLAAPDLELRQQARSALRQIADLCGLPVAAEPYHGIFITSLGHTNLYVDNQEIRLDSWVRQEFAQVGWQKVQGVLGYLVHCGARGTTQAALEAAVWGRRPTPTFARTMQALRQLLGSLRGEPFAAQALVVADQHCLLRPDVYQTDVRLFEQAFAAASRADEVHGLEAAAPLYHQALRLYGGPYMIAMPNGAAWAHERRDHLRGNFLIAADRLAEHAFAQQRYRECIAICSEVFDADESADDIVVWMLRAYQRLRQTGAMEQVYRRYLAANTLNECSPDARQDVVVRVYQQLYAARAS